MIGRICALLIGYLIGNIRGRLLCKCFISKVIDMAKVIIPSVGIVYGYFYKARGGSPENFCALYYLVLGIVFGHNYPIFLRSVRDNCIAVYWGVVLLLTFYNPFLTFFCLVIFFGELYVTRNYSRAVSELIIVFIVGFMVGSYFGHYWPVDRLIEINIIMIIISILTYKQYKTRTITLDSAKN